MNARQLGFEAGMEKAAISKAKSEWAAGHRGVDPRMHKAIVLERMTRSPKAREHAAKAENLKSEFSPFHQTLQRASWARSKRGGSLIDRIIKNAGISQEALEEHVREGRHVSPRMMQHFGISGEQMQKARQTAGSAKTRIGKGFKEAPTKSMKGPVMSPTKVLNQQSGTVSMKPSGPPKPVPSTDTKKHPILSAIHMAKTHPDPAKRQRMTKLVKDWHKAKSAKTALAMLSQRHLDARAAGLAQVKKTGLADKALKMALSHPDPEKRKRMAELVLKYRREQAKAARS